eukprot:Unigene1782_Nuclearia_a/m.5532 Unigene1782_Nuclearia_a/g.5532  ORF Unigene1782_Nuclearia_a/g.5532 Unigene1782_Nuclearia_a/m.5532 type:complete len:437 (-) Unigene1782_Nuclearia_a:1304-2614(-)
MLMMTSSSNRSSRSSSYSMLTSHEPLLAGVGQQLIDSGIAISSFVWYRHLSTPSACPTGNGRVGSFSPTLPSAENMRLSTFGWVLNWYVFSSTPSRLTRMSALSASEMRKNISPLTSRFSRPPSRLLTTTSFSSITTCTLSVFSTGVAAEAFALSGVGTASTPRSRPSSTFIASRKSVADCFFEPSCMPRPTGVAGLAAAVLVYDDDDDVRPDLVFFFHRDVEREPDVAERVRAAIAAGAADAVQTCFRRVRFVGARLSDDEDAYPLGASVMFFRLFKLPGLRNDYDVLYLMEPDNRPCRAGWLDQLWRDAYVHSSEPPWMSGSITRDGVERDVFGDHLNGNALYRLGDATFRALLARVEAVFMERPADYVHSYDVALDVIRRDRGVVSFAEYAASRHRFVYTVTMQNWYRTAVNATELCAAAPSTFLVHGRNVYL